MPEFLLHALIVGCGVALLAGPLGSFAVWRRMAYFGDTLAHSALTGIALGLLLSINTSLAVTLCCLLIALVLLGLQQNRSLATDTLLGILSHTSLAFGLVMIAIFGEGRIDLYSYLFGDLLAANIDDIKLIGLTGLIVLPMLAWLWQPLLSVTVHEELAKVEGIPVAWVKAALMLMMALVIAVAMKVVGVMLITALLIIPAAASRRLAKSPTQMAMIASTLGMLSIIGGLATSFYYDWPAGPASVLSAAFIFCLTQLKRTDF